MRAPKSLAGLVILATVLLARRAESDVAHWTPRANGFYGNVYTAFQANTPLRRPFDDDKKVYPFYQYLDVHGFSPGHNLSMSTFVRTREVANGDEATLDVYNANLDYRGLCGALEV